MKITSANTNAFFFTWNPKKWSWSHLRESIQELEKTGKTSQRWVCQSHKKVKIGDIAFLIRLGVEPKGVCASGTIVRDGFRDQHYSDNSKFTNYVEIEFDVLLDPSVQPILPLEDLRRELPLQKWDSNSSGISIKPEVVEDFENKWLRFLDEHKLVPHPTTLNSPGNHGNEEGASYEVTLTRYERDKNNRNQCLKIHGYSCKACEIDFERVYGTIGRNYIHVHHITPLSTMGARIIDPEKDLVPVCPNCHAMLHKTNPPYTIEELKKLMQENSMRGIVDSQ